MNLHAITPRLRHSLSVLTLSLLVGAAHAEAPRQNALSFSASATEEVTQDLLVVTLQATREGNQASDVQTALKQVMESALTEARKAAQGQPGIEVRTGSFSVQPRYTNAGRISGWQGSAQLVLEGTDRLKEGSEVEVVNDSNQVPTTPTEHLQGKSAATPTDAAVTDKAKKGA